MPDLLHERHATCLTIPLIHVIHAHVVVVCVVWKAKGGLSAGLAKGGVVATILGACGGVWTEEAGGGGVGGGGGGGGGGGRRGSCHVKGVQDAVAGITSC